MKDETANGNDYTIDEASLKQALHALSVSPTEENLWNCIVAFQGYSFYTWSGLPFTYSLKTGRNGNYTKEIFIDRRENSKSLTWASIKLAFHKVMEKTDMEGGIPLYKRPKDIGDIRGISYIYGIFYRFGIIDVAAK